MPIQKRGKAWQVTVNYTVNGVPKRKTKSGFRTKTEAAAYEATLKLELAKEPEERLSDMLFTEYYDQWLVRHLKTLDRDNSIRSHESTQTIVHEHFSGIPLSDMTRQVMQDFLYKYAETHKVSTTNMRMKLIGIPLREAFHEGIIKRDPTHGLKYPKSDNAPKDTPDNYLEKADMDTLLNHITTTPPTADSFAVLTALLSGMRIGEVLALTWDDIDVSKGSVTVNKTKLNTHPKTYGPPKTPASYRTISMPTVYFDVLAEYKKYYKKAHPDHIFGEDAYQQKVHYYLKSIAKKLGIKPVSPHGLRHTHASYLIGQGIDIAYVSERLGHSSVATTQNIYIHLLQDTRDEENQRTLDLFNT